MTTRTAGVHGAGREVGHHFVLRGWTTGVTELSEVLVLIAGTPALLSADEPTEHAPQDALNWLAEPKRPVPHGTHEVAVSGPSGEQLTGTSVTVGRKEDEPPLWIGQLESPRIDVVEDGNVVYVCGWALLDSAAPSMVEVMVEGAKTVRARSRLPRPDAAREFPQFPDAAISGFEARVPVDLPQGQDKELSVKVRYSKAGVGEHVSPRRVFRLSNPPPDPDDTALAAELRAETARALARVQGPSDDRHLLVFTHSLALGGGQLWLQELLNRLVIDHGWTISLVTETDGQLRADCTELGIPVHLTTHYRHSTVADYEGHVAELARFAKCSGASVALINTLGAFPAADAAKRAGIPVAWTIHESFSLADFAYQNWGPCTPPSAVWERWEGALAEADQLLFVADATREMFLPYSKPERCRTVRYGTPMAKFGGRTRAQARTQARELLKIDPSETLLVNIGVVESRKGQGPLIAAMERVWPSHPSARLCVIGFHPSPYGLALADTIERNNLDAHVKLVPIQPDPTPWLQAADIFVNASDIESLPRSILESVSCGIPVAATDVFGAREMIADSESGWLFEAGDVDAIASTLLRALDTPVAKRRSMAEAAYNRLADWLPPSGYAAEYAQILTELAENGAQQKTGGNGAGVA